MKWNGIELKAGDKVKLTNKRPSYWSLEGKMDRYLGRVVTISAILSDDGSFGIIQDSDDNYRWAFDVEDIDSVSLTDNVPVTLADLSYKGSEFIKPEYTAKIKIGNLEINLTDKTFTYEQIKNMKEMLGWDVENLVEA